MMCIFQVHLISTNLNPTGERATLRQIELVSVLRSFAPPPPPRGKLHVSSLQVHRGALWTTTTIWGPRHQWMGRPAKKSWKFIFFFVINLCITFTVYKDSSVRPRKKRYTHLDFRVVQNTREIKYLKIS